MTIKRSNSTISIKLDKEPEPQRSLNSSGKLTPRGSLLSKVSFQVAEAGPKMPRDDSASQHNFPSAKGSGSFKVTAREKADADFDVEAQETRPSRSSARREKRASSTAGLPPPRQSEPGIRAYKHRMSQSSLSIPGFDLPMSSAMNPLWAPDTNISSIKESAKETKAKPEAGDTNAARERARTRWQSAGRKVEAMVAMRDAPLHEKVQEKVKGVDAYATKIVESTLEGGVITVLVWAATIAYVVLLAVQWKSTPPTKTVGTEWTIGAGPFPMKMQCMARSGCLVSNIFADAGNTLGASTQIDPGQSQCFRLDYQETVTADVVFSVDPSDGLSVMFDPATTQNTTTLPNGGLVIISEIRCPFINAPLECVFSLPTPIGPGTALLQHVDTTNETAAGPAMHRREWFANMIDQSGSVMPGSTACYNSSASTDLAGWVQARLRINSFYNTVDVSKDSFWLFLFGAAGGAYAVFLQAGGLLLLTMHVLAGLRRVKPAVKPATAPASTKNGYQAVDTKTPAKTTPFKAPPTANSSDSNLRTPARDLLVNTLAKAAVARNISRNFGDANTDWIRAASSDGETAALSRSSSTRSHKKLLPDDDRC